MKTTHKLSCLILGLSLFGLSLMFLNNAEATSGACSYHGGVECSAGRTSNGSVICNDGWTESMTYYDFTEKCQSNYSSCTYPIAKCSNEKLNELKMLVLLDYKNSGGNLGFSSITYAHEQDVKLCEEQINNYQNELNIYQNCINQEIQQQQKETQLRLEELNKNMCPENSDNISGLCYCKNGYAVDPVLKNRCILTNLACKFKYGQYSTDIPNTLNCMCDTGYQWNDTKTQCIEIPKIKLPEIPKISQIETNLNSLNIKSGWLIKNKKYAEVFFVDSNLCLQWIINEKVALKHFGNFWWQKVKDYDEIPKGYKFCKNYE